MSLKVIECLLSVRPYHFLYHGAGILKANESLRHCIINEVYRQAEETKETRRALRCRDGETIHRLVETKVVRRV
jgi:hypothetical protein